MIHGFISNSYWAEGIPRETLERALRHSLCLGVFDAEQSQVGFARLITDYATYAYLADVFVLESHRGLGLSKRMLEEIQGHSELQGLRRVALVTKDAHGLYEKFGFEPLKEPGWCMEKWDPEIYRRC